MKPKTKPIPETKPVPENRIMRPNRAQDLRSRIANASNELPDSWIPKQPGDYISGVIIDVSERATKFTDHCTVVTVVDDADGAERSIWGTGSVLSGEFARRQLAVGDRLGVRRLKDGKTRDGTPYNAFRVIVERGGRDASDDAPPPDESQAVVDEDTSFTDGAVA